MTTTIVDNLQEYAEKQGGGAEHVQLEDYPVYYAGKPYGSLYISKDAFLHGQDVKLTEGMVKNLQGFDYLNIAHAKYLLKLHFDTLEVHICTNEHGEPVFDLPDSRGSLVGVFLQDSRTGLKSAVTWFPVMGRSRKGAIKPAEIDSDSRCINDNIARAVVKCIAFTVGIGFEIYSRLEEEDLIEAEEASGMKTSTIAQKKKQKAAEVELEDDYNEEEDELDEEEEEEEEKVPARTKFKSRFPSARSSSTRRKM